MNPMSSLMLVMSIICAVILAACAAVGFFKGWKKSLLSLCRAALSLVLAFAATAVICRALPAGSLLANIFGNEGLMSSEAIRLMAGNAAYSLAAPFVFLVLFIILDLILRIPAHFVGVALGICGEKAEDHTPSLGGRFGGAGIKLALGLAVALVAILPFANIFYSLTDGVVRITDIAKEKNVSLDLSAPDIVLFNNYKITDSEGLLDSAEIDRMADDFISPVGSNIFMRASYCAPMRALCNAMAGTSDPASEGRGEVAQILDLACDAVYFAVPLENYGEEQKAAVSDIIGYISESELHSEAAADAVAYFSAKAVADGKKPLGEGNIEIISTPLFEILANTTAESIRDDFNTLRDIVVTMIDFGLPADIATALETKSEDALISALGDEALLFELLSSLYSNDDYRGMVAPVTDYAFTVVMHRFDPEAGRMQVANVNENYTEEGIKNEAKIFAAVLADAPAVMDIAPALSASENAASAMLSSDISALGRFVDNARDSELIGEGVTELCVAILNTSAFDSMRGVSDVLIANIESDADISVESVFAAAQDLVKIADICKDSSAGDTAALAQALQSLDNSCDPATTAVIKDMIKESDILESALPAAGDPEKADNANKVMNVMLDELSAGEFTDEEYEKEARAMDIMMRLLAAKTRDEVKSVCGEAEDTRAMLDTVLDSKLATASLIEVAYVDGDPAKPLSEDALGFKSTLEPGDVEMIRAECKNYYMEKVSLGTDTAQLDINIKAVSAVFDGGVTDEVLAAWRAEAGN